MQLHVGKTVFFPILVFDRWAAFSAVFSLTQYQPRLLAD